MFFVRLATTLLVLGLVVSCTAREPYAAPIRVSGISFLPEKDRTMAPFPHVVFCLHSPSQCKDGGGANLVVATGKTQAVLDSVNNSVNSSITPRESAGEPWKINPPAGDCNDYAVSKRSKLIQAGLSTRAVRLAVAMTPQGIGHTVVVVRTTNGDVVLDNRTSAIKRWDKTDLSWLKVQSSSNPKNWDSL